MEYWNIQREWEGETCAVLASGPSMSYELSEKIRRLGVRTIAVNNQGIDVGNKPAMAPWADILYAADQLWWHNNRDAALSFKGIKVTIMPSTCVARRESEEVRLVGNGGQTGFDSRTTHLRSGGNSGYQAIHLAAHLGVKRILLFGFDMHSKNGEHWFGYHAWRLGHKGNYSLFLGRFDSLAPELRGRGIEVLNCTPGSALKCFPMMPLEEVFTDGLQGLRESTTTNAENCASSAREVRTGNVSVHTSGAG